MPDNKEPKSASEILDALFDFIEETDDDPAQMPIEKVQLELKKEGIDPTPAVEAVLEMVAAARARRELQRARDNRMHLESLSRQRSRTPLSPNDRQAKYGQAVRGAGTAAVFRKFEGATGQDQDTTLDDLELLDEIEDEDEGEPRG